MTKAKNEINQKLSVKSSIIDGYSWNPKNQKVGNLNITFKQGDSYRYADVDKEIYSKFDEAKSKGSYFSQHIKDKFVTKKIELVEKQEKIHASYVPLGLPFPTGPKP